MKEVNSPGRTRLRFFSSIAFRLPLIVAGVLALILIATTGTSYITTRSGLEDIQETNLRTQAGVQADAIEKLLRQHAARMENLAGRQTIRERVTAANNNYLTLNNNEIRTSLNERAQQWAAAIEAGDFSNPIISRVTRDFASQDDLIPESESISQVLGLTSNYMLMDREGALIATSFPPEEVPRAYLQSDTDWWQIVDRSKSLFVGQPDTPVGGSITVMEFAMPVTNSAGEAIGTLYSTFDYKAVREQIRQTQAADSGRTALVTQHGEVLFAAVTLLELSLVTDLPIADAAENLAQYTDSEGTRRPDVSQTVPGNRHAVAVGRTSRNVSRRAFRFPFPIVHGLVRFAARAGTRWLMRV
jgi:hypothetical protein